MMASKYRRDRSTCHRDRVPAPEPPPSDMEEDQSKLSGGILDLCVEKDTRKLFQFLFGVLNSMLLFPIFRDLKPGATLSNETRTICNRWAYPDSVNRRILVLAMNEYLHTDDIYIPGKITLIPFSLASGIHLNRALCSHVDPCINIPAQHMELATINAVKFGLAKVSSSFDGARTQDYVKIVNEIDKFIRSNSEPFEGEVYLVFCLKEFVDCYYGGLHWLYSVAGKGAFPHKLVSLETVLVELSHGGLKSIAKQNEMGRKDHHKIMGIFTRMVNGVSRSVSELDIQSHYDPRPLQCMHIRRLLTE